MGDCHCSNIAIMQLFHELKQQFPALPDHVVSECIAQNSHDRETCTESLRLTQELRPSPGAFPPPAPDLNIRGMSLPEENLRTQIGLAGHSHQSPKAHRPVSLDIGPTRRSPLHSTRRVLLPPLPQIHCNPLRSGPSSAPAAYSTRGFFDDLSGNQLTSPVDNFSTIRNINSSGFELNVNVACSPASNRDFRTVQSPKSKRNDLGVDSRPIPESRDQINPDQTRSYTSVSLTLRPPSSEPQPPIDIRSQGSSLTYSTSSVDPRGFQSRLQISIGPGNIGSVAAARIRPPMGHARPNSLIPVASPHRPPGLPAGPPSQLPRPTTTMSAPTTPSAPAIGIISNPSSLPTTPSNPVSSFPSQIKDAVSIDLSRLSQYSVTENQKKLITEQLLRKEKLAKELKIEKGRLEAIKKEINAIQGPVYPIVSLEKRAIELKSEIYQLELECGLLTNEVDKSINPNVPLGETNEEFYHGIYRGQPINLPVTSPPPLPSVPPAWDPSAQNLQSNQDEEERDGPSWICEKCTFDNHPLIDICEVCLMPRFRELEDAGTRNNRPRIINRQPQTQQPNSSSLMSNISKQSTSRV
ncbi:TGF-beta-activated kinase 1 and MAP3K7-binding protein 2 isoform X2 [Microplitis demolitor]|uniref:TGF-beta-activated kinase 1 and MAP3K7-binding protein 2 isoform X2 n=1 Tax=Microplitis demolitor TaxID=69319 RepID=UPI0004CD1618|nr:TGF-beta-activated kinase 1 and MAP3K7-binding protein 2 isoform X2 [Microplitis demolitor]